MFESKEKMLEFLLDKLTQEIDLPESKYKETIERYEAVGNYLGDDDSDLSLYNPTIFPQGSFRLGTVVKPFKADEYDIDLVCHLELDQKIGQKKLYDMVGKRLAENGHYTKLLKPQRRCWRLDYANEFHMDILPAIPDQTRNDNSIQIPDRELLRWQPSNPKDYVTWFYSMMQTRREIMIAEARAEIETVPFFKFKTPLQKVIQLLKRHRDIVFEDDCEDKPVSIIITTLAAKAYNNDARLYESLVYIIEEMPNQFDSLNGEVAVLNPVNEKENFADKWTQHHQRKEKFFQWLVDLKYTIEEVLKIEGLPKLNEKLGDMFGKPLIDTVFRKHADMIQERRDSGLLKATGTGVLGATGAMIKKSTFYGD